MVVELSLTETIDFDGFAPAPALTCFEAAKKTYDSRLSSGRATLKLDTEAMVAKERASILGSYLTIREQIAVFKCYS